VEDTPHAHVVWSLEVEDEGRVPTERRAATAWRVELVVQRGEPISGIQAERAG